MRGKREKPAPNLLGKLIVFCCVAIVFGLICLAAELIAPIFVVDPAPTTELEIVPPAPSPVPENTYDLTQFTSQDGWISYGGAEAATGIDISDHQKVIDWAMVAESGVDYAIVRIGYRGYTQGSITMDKYYKENLAGALDNGLEVGAYFFSQAISVEEAIEEANLVVESLEGYDITYPVVFDWEDISVVARTDNMTPQLLMDCTIAFCQVIEEAGYIPGVYFNQTFGYEKFDLSRMQDYVLWLAQYDTAPDFRYHFDMWQYTASGIVPGIETIVDLNLSFWKPQ